MEARSLRAQMNPHFIYNALNSLQSVMILKGERESNRYIGMLSKLLRFTLEMSTTERITLEEEIDYLDSYLGLQKMRLDSKMEYKIELDLKQNIKEYSLPPMLIQPLVENSILHGISSLKDRMVWGDKGFGGSRSPQRFPFTANSRGSHT
ncbi:histidine kinase [Flavobacteriaceae bacterium]|nr:histidine kinase [Flavobacteriaceae bacterium]